MERSAESSAERAATDRRPQAAGSRSASALCSRCRTGPAGRARIVERSRAAQAAQAGSGRFRKTMERLRQMDTPGIASTKKMRINHEETKNTKIFPILSSCSSFLRGYFLYRTPELIAFLILAFSALPLRAQPALPDNATE